MRRGGLKKQKQKQKPARVGSPCLKYRCQIVMLKKIIILKYHNVCVSLIRKNKVDMNEY